jgi:hypothetical protein
MDKPYYPYRAIGSIEALAKTLGIHPKILVDLSNKIDESYTEFSIEQKNKKPRTVYDPKYELKRIQKRINTRILEKVQYPNYLVGGIKERDYVLNAKIHGGNEHLITLDIKKFFDNIRPKHVEKIFLYLFKFPQDVSDLLTKLVVYGNKVPQGACTSSYIANLLFFNSEYQIVSEFRSKNINYTRLLDDITISSPAILSDDKITEYIKVIAALFKKYELKLNAGKTKIETRRDLTASFEVTGLWVGHKLPKSRNHERKHFRHLVYICEKEFNKSSVTDEYHALWNKTSGAIAKLKRLGHSQHRGYRVRLSAIMPTFDENAQNKLIMDVKKVVQTPVENRTKMGVTSRVNKIHYRLGILGRTNKVLAKNLRKTLVKNFVNMKSKVEIWE